MENITKQLAERLNNLLSDEDLTDDKLREASEGLLPNIADFLNGALRKTDSPNKNYKQNISAATPKEICDMLLVYKDAVNIPLHNFFDIMKCLPKDKHHLFAIAVKNDTVHIEYSETVSRY